MLEIDGSFGEGGGQILRTSLALSLITGTAFRIVNVRAGRAKPGLRRQHLTAVRAAARIGSARVSGDAVGSGELTFEPGVVASGVYEFDIGTAGSTTLVFQTVLPALIRVGARLRFRGGTHNHGGPPWDFVEGVFLPVLRRMGARVSTSLERHGFAPAGGGAWSATIEPGDLRGIILRERVAGPVRARVLWANLPAHVADREICVLRERLPHAASSAERVEADGPGNIVMIGNGAEMATGFGQRGVLAEKVAGDAASCWLEYERSGAPVGEHLADQLLLPLALAGSGSFVTMRPTLHTQTNVQTIAKFLPVRFAVEPLADGRWLISL